MPILRRKEKNLKSLSFCNWLVSQIKAHTIIKSIFISWQPEEEKFTFEIEMIVNPQDCFFEFF